jgi:hypothetical protein
MVQRPSYRGPALYFRLLAGITRVWVHWAECAEGEKSLPCLRDECQLCPSCDLRWRGYAPVMAYERGAWVPRVMEASENFVDLLGKDLRGKAVQVWKEAPDRRRHKESVPILYNFIPEEHTYTLPELPEAFDFVPFLLRLWEKPALTDHEGREYTRFLAGGFRPTSKVLPPWCQPAAPVKSAEAEATERSRAAWDALPENDQDAIRVIVLAKHPHLSSTPHLLEGQCARELARRSANSFNGNSNGNGHHTPARAPFPQPEVHP